MDIIFFCDEYPPGRHGGVGSFTQTLARGLAQHGHSVRVIGLYPPGRAGVEDDQGVSVIRLPAYTQRGPGALLNGLHLHRAVKNLLDPSKPQVLEGPELSLAYLPKQLPIPKIIRIHGGHTFFSHTLGKKPRFWRSQLEKISFAHADALCAVSRFAAETTRALLHLGERPITILPNPVNTHLFQPHPEIAEAPGSILFVGTLCEKKGVRQLIQAMPMICQQVPQAHLWLVGRDTVDPTSGQSYTAEMKKIIPADIADKIKFAGALENAQLPQWIARASVCVYPSHMETQGIVIAEAMAMGKAVVASRLGPGPEIIQDGVEGLLCDPRQPESIAEKVVLGLADPAYRARLGENARRKAQQEFSLETLLPRIIEFYRSVIG